MTKQPPVDGRSVRPGAQLRSAAGRIGLNLVVVCAPAHARERAGGAAAHVCAGAYAMTKQPSLPGRSVRPAATLGAAERRIGRILVVTCTLAHARERAKALATARGQLLGRDSQTASSLPSGSRKTPNQPWPGTSAFGSTTDPPSSVTFWSAASTESTWT